MIAIQLENVTKRYGRITAVNNLSLNVENGTVFGFLGPNGAGKSTTIKMLSGFLYPNSGDIRVFGYDIYRDGKMARAMMGLVPDQYGFYDELNAVEHLYFYGRLNRIPEDELKVRVKDIIELVGMTAWATFKTRTYSHGMRQRLVLAQALIHKPSLLLLDEPTSGLDPESSYSTRQLIKHISERGVTIFISSHLLYELQDICDMIGIINRGNLIRVDSLVNLTNELRAKSGLYVIIECTHPCDEMKNKVIDVKGVLNVDVNKSAMKIKLENTDIIPDIVTIIVNSGGRIKLVREEIPSLADIYLSMVGGGS